MQDIIASLGEIKFQMIVEVRGLGSDRKEEGKGFMSANQTTSFTSSGRGLCLSFKGKRPKSSNSQCLCVHVICLGGITDVKTHKHCISNSSQ